MGRRITAADTFDIRFPTSLELDGSDAVHTDPDYSAAYVVLRTDAGAGVEGHGFCFTLGRGNEIEVAALEALGPLVVGLDLDEIVADSRSFSRLLTQDSQMRWLGPEKGVVHMAAAAIITAVWDLAAKDGGQTPMEVSGRSFAGATGGHGRLPVPVGRADRGGGGRDVAARRAGQGGERAPAAGARVPGLRHESRVARLLGLQAGAAVPRGG